MKKIWFAVLVVALVAVGSRASAQDVNACIAANEKSIALRKAGKLLDARKELATCSADGCPNAIKTVCRKRMGEVNDLVPGVVFDVKDASGASLTQVNVTVDGAPLTDHLDGTAVPVDPGQHTFRFEAQGAPPVEKTFLVAEGEKAHRETLTLGAAQTATPENGASPPKHEDTKTPPDTHDASATPGQSSRGGVYVQAAVGGVGWMYFPNPFNAGVSYDWAGFRPDIELGFHPSGRADGFVVGLRQAFTMTAFGGIVMPRVAGVSSVRLGWDIPITIAGHELDVAPYLSAGIGYVFDGLTGFGGPSAGVLVNGGVEGRFFVASGFYAFARPFEGGVQCYHDVGQCGFDLVVAAGVGYAFGEAK